MDEALIKRVLPHSIEAEQSVVGSMLMDKEAILTASELLVPEDFYGRQYGVMFDAIVELYNEGSPVDMVTVRERLREKEVPPEVSSVEFIRDLINAVPFSINIKQYADIVYEKSVLRKLIKVNEEIEGLCYQGKERLDVILGETEKKVFQLLQSRNSGDFVSIKETVIKTLEKIELASRTKGNVTGIPTGFYDLDYMTAGLQPSDFILIGARPSMGKTALVLNLAEYIAIRNNTPIAIFSLEMSREQLMNRMFAMEARVDLQKLRTGDLSDTDWEKLIESAGVIGKSGLIIDDTPGISIGELRSKCRKYKLEHNLS